MSHRHNPIPVELPPASAGRYARSVPYGHQSVRRSLSVALAAGLIPLVCMGGAGCATRSSTPTVAADSTVVYPSKVTDDVAVSITFELKNSKKREEQRRLERSRQRRIEKERKEREAKEQAERAKAKRKTSSSKSKKPVKKTAKPTKPTASSSKPAEKAPSLPREERVFELEEGARVQASVRIENPYGRGTRPLMFHTVWLNPEGKRVFKRMTEWTPNDSSQVITTSLTIPPSRRTAGQYGLQVYLFRELIASKTIQLMGESTAPQEKDDTGGM